MQRQCTHDATSVQRPPERLPVARSSTSLVHVLVQAANVGPTRADARPRARRTNPWTIAMPSADETASAPDNPQSASETRTLSLVIHREAQCAYVDPGAFP
jgi:hypothetical protein